MLFASDRVVFDVTSASFASEDLLAGVTATGAGPAFFWKKLAMFRCLGSDFCVFRLGVFFAFGSTTSFPSIPLAIFVLQSYSPTIVQQWPKKRSLSKHEQVTSTSKTRNEESTRLSDYVSDKQFRPLWDRGGHFNIGL